MDLREEFQELADHPVGEFGFIEVNPHPHAAILPVEESGFGFHQGNQSVFVREITAEMKAKQLSILVIIWKQGSTRRLFNRHVFSPSKSCHNSAKSKVTRSYSHGFLRNRPVIARRVSFPAVAISQPRE